MALDPNDILTDRDRILMVAWTLPNEGTLTDDMRRDAMQNFDKYCKRAGLTYAKVARAVDKPRATTIHDLVHGVYRETADKHIRVLNAFIEQHARQQAVKLDGDFVQTRIAKEILGVARLVRENQTMGLAFGPTGIGKSRCAQALYAETPGSILISIFAGFHHPKGLTSVIAHALGVRDTYLSRQTKFLSTVERVIERLKESGRLLIIDEAHELNDDAINLLRHLHDHTGIPMLLLATKDLHERIERTADSDHGQVYSRFDVIYPLTQGSDPSSGGRKLFSLDEIRKLYQHTPIRLAPDAQRYLQDVANELGRGSLRRCGKLLTNGARRARKRQGLAAKDNVTVTADDLAFADECLRPHEADKEAVRQRRLRAAKSA